jgi:secondary thiamine-phosphate synthase enzyme
VPLVPDAEIAVNSVAGYETLAIETTEPLQFVDLTDRLAGLVKRFDLMNGILMVQSRHTTAGIMVNEHEPLLLDDLRRMFERLVPADAAYAHDDFTRRTINLTSCERHNAHAHCRAALLRTSETIAIVKGELSLGRWQRIFFVDFDGGQRREVGVTVLGTAGA